MNYDSFINSLSKDELYKLRATIDNKLGEKTSPAPAQDLEGLESDARVVYDAIQKTLSLRGGRNIPWRMFQTSQDARNLEKRSKWLSEFIEDKMKPRSKIEHIWCLEFVTQLVIDFLDRNSLPVSTRTIINNLDRVPSLLEGAFPGYMRASILPMIIAQVRR